LLIESDEFPYELDDDELPVMEPAVLPLVPVGFVGFAVAGFELLELLLP
jgi:hypothetical protein